MELRERRARTLPARLRDRNQLKRDASAVWDLQRASCTEQMMLHALGPACPEPEEPEEPEESALTAAASALEAPPQRASPMDDSRSEASASLCEAKQSHSEASAEMTSTAHLAAASSRPVRGSTWPRVRRQRTPNGAMSIWELSSALGNAPAEPSGRTLTPEQIQDDQRFVDAMLGTGSGLPSPAGALVPNPPPPAFTDHVRAESAALVALGADLSRASLLADDATLDSSTSVGSTRRPCQPRTTFRGMFRRQTA